VHSLASQLPPDELVSTRRSGLVRRRSIAAQAFEVVATTAHACDPDVLPGRARSLAPAVRFVLVRGSGSARLSLRRLRRDPGIGRIVGGPMVIEVGWAKLPGRQAATLAHGKDVDTVTYLGDYTLARSAPRWAETHFTPAAERCRSDAFFARSRWRDVGVAMAAGSTVIVCVSRL